MSLSSAFNHDEECEFRVFAKNPSCRCGLRALEVRLAKAERERDAFRLDQRGMDSMRAFMKMRPEAHGLDVATVVAARLTALESQVSTLQAALYPLVVGGLEAEAREDCPEYVDGEVYNGMRALPECAACGGTGATDRKQYEDQPIPEAVVCPECFGWGFLMHPFTKAES